MSGTENGTGAVTTATTNCSSSNGGQLDSFTDAPNGTVSTAISFAEEQIGKPYLFGGTGPAAFDCSGLVMMAYKTAGVDIARTSQAQWATLPHVSANQVQVGDLVFFAGSDGTRTAPGHVGLVIGKNKMVEAYATGTAIRISTYGLASSAPGDGVGEVVGFAQPWPQTQSPTPKQPEQTQGAARS